MGNVTLERAVQETISRQAIIATERELSMLRRDDSVDSDTSAIERTERELRVLQKAAAVALFIRPNQRISARPMHTFASWIDTANIPYTGIRHHWDLASGNIRPSRATLWIRFFSLLLGQKEIPGIIFLREDGAIVSRIIAGGNAPSARHNIRETDDELLVDMERSLDALLTRLSD